MCCIELFLTITGLVTLFRGRVNLYGTGRVVEGTAAYLVGLLLILPFTVIFALGFMRGYETAQAGKPFNLEAYNDLAALEIGLWVVCGVVAGIIAVCCARKPLSAEDVYAAGGEYIRQRAGSDGPGQVRLQSENFLPRKQGPRST
jgi:hypothetical protein